MILVTGGTGLVGGHLLWHLLQNNEKVIAIRRPSSDLKPLHSIFSFYHAQYETYLARIEWRFADVLDRTSMVQAMQGVTVVYHCAGIVPYGKAGDDILDTNVRGTRNIVEAAKTAKIKKLCFVSSIAACGKADHGIEIDENTPWYSQADGSQYAQSKYLSEQEVWKGIADGLEAVIVNPGIILGFSGTASGSSKLFSRVKKGLMFYTDGGSGYVDVQDVVKIMIALVNSEIKNERFILVAENCSNYAVLCLMADGYKKRRPSLFIGREMFLTVAWIVEKLGLLFHFNPLIDRSTARSACSRSYYSNLKIRQALGFSFRPVSNCIKEVCDFEMKQ